MDFANITIGLAFLAGAAIVRLRFTEPLNTSTVTSASVLLLDVTTGATVPVFPPVVDPPGHVTLDPVAPLALGHLYRVVVTPGVTDETGNPAVFFSSRFRTVATLAGDVTLPTVSEALAGLGVTSSTGAAVAKVGDLDGDGIDDLLVGAPGYAVSGAVEAGAAAVYLGSTDPAERATPDIIFTGGSAHDRLGASVAGGFDFNGDGFRDLLIGATQVNLTSDDDPVAGCDAGAPCGKGKAYVVYFDPADYPNLGNPSVSDIVAINSAGQTKCCDDTQEIPCPEPGEPFFGQDGNYTINPPSYTKLDVNGNTLPDDAGPGQWSVTI